jgi:hypothetical protein
MTDDHVPVDAEARGKLRVWLAEVGKEADSIEQAYDRVLADDTQWRTVRDFMWCAPKGRARALARLERIFNAPAFTENNGSFAMWFHFRPLNEGGVTLCAICVSSGSGRYFRTVRFPIEFTHHALARVLQRCPNADLSKMLIEAHIVSMILSVKALEKGGRFRLRAGDGAFAFDLLPGPLIRAATWLHNDQLSEQQETQIIPIGVQGDRLIESMILLAGEGVKGG